MRARASRSHDGSTRSTAPVFEKLSERDRAAVRHLFPAAHLGKGRSGSHPPSGHQVVLPLRRPAGIPFRASLLHQRLHGLPARVPILLRHRLHRGGAQLQESLPPRLVQGLGGVGGLRCSARARASVEQHRSASALGAAASPHAFCAGEAGGAPQPLHNRHAVDEESGRADG